MGQILRKIPKNLFLEKIPLDMGMGCELLAAHHQPIIQIGVPLPQFI